MEPRGRIARFLRSGFAQPCSPNDCDGTSGAAALFVSHDIRDIVERDDGVFSSSSSGHHPHPFMKERFFHLLTIEAE
ncbi:hypothetical protein [Sinorhizobium meliloti]|uniref:hypothetical protein n=1 Tax=Rhizobium meliloti TaxID=382 RepID=UPI0013E2F0CB|nr:hypothetical protein [Sinorhizobium meliloti]